MDEQQYGTFDEARAAAQDELRAQEAAAQEAAAQEAAAREAAAQEAAAQEAAQEPQGSPHADAPQDAQANAVNQMMAQQQQMQQIVMQNQQLAMQNQQLQQMVKEMSDKNKEETVEAALEPPVMDMSGLWSEDANVIRQKQQEFSRQMADYMEKKMESKLAPFVESARRGEAERQQQEALSGLSQVPELSGIMGMTPTLERIINSNPALAGANVPIEDKLITAYAIAKGAEAIRNAQEPPKELGIDDFMAVYEKNPELQKRVELERAQRAAQNVAQTPPMSASAGTASAALTPQEKPKDFEEARRLVAARLGL